jgi:hypothetical protein
MVMAFAFASGLVVSMLTFQTPAEVSQTVLQVSSLA